MGADVLALCIALATMGIVRQRTKQILVFHKEWFIHPPLDEMAAFSPTIFPDAFYWMKGFVFSFESHWCLLLGVQLTIRQHSFRKWLGAEQATSHYLNQWWLSLLKHICGSTGRWINSLWTSDASWWHRFRLTLSQVMARCLTPPSHYLTVLIYHQWISMASTWEQAISQEMLDSSIRNSICETLFINIGQ